MKNILVSIAAVIVALVATSCSKDDYSAPSWNEERPEWVENIPAEASVNMTVWVQIPTSETVSCDDILAAFIDGECRAIARHNEEVTHEYQLTIKGVAGETSPITLKYYNAARRHTFTDSGSLSFVVDGIVGDEEPIIFKLD